MSTGRSLGSKKRSAAQWAALGQLNGPNKHARTIASPETSPELASNSQASSSSLSSQLDITTLQHSLVLGRRRELSTKNQLSIARQSAQNLHQHTWHLEAEAEAMRERNSGLESDLERSQASLSEIQENLATLQLEYTYLAKQLSSSQEQNQTSVARLEECRARTDHTKDAMRKKISRCAEALAREVDKAVEIASRAFHERTRHVQMKEHGQVRIDVRELVRRLSGYGIATTVVDRVLHDVTTTFGLELDDHISRKSVSRIILEGLFIAKMQLAVEMSIAKGDW
jgi:chromosome segregation ATPase